MSVQRTPPESTKRPRIHTSPEEVFDKNPKKRTMNEEVGLVGSMSKRDLLEAIGDMLDVKLESVASKEDIRLLQQELSAVKGECDALKLEISRLRNSNISLQKKLDDTEKREKNNNLIFKGLPESDQATNDTIKQFCKEHLSVDDLQIRNSYRLGRKDNTKTRPILVEFVMQDHLKSILFNKKKLKNSKINIHRDLTLNTRKKHNFLWEVKKEITKVNKNLKIEVRGEQLIVNDNVLLCTEDFKLITKEGDTTEILANKFGLDIGRIIACVSAKSSLNTNVERKRGNDEA